MTKQPLWRRTESFMIGAMMKGFRKTAGTLLAWGLVSASLASCAVPGIGTLSEERQCKDLIRRVDLRIEQQGVADAEAVRVEGFPYLRINRFLASFAGEIESDEAFDEWVSRLRTLDRTARAIELRNMGAANITEMMELCTDRLETADRADPTFPARLMRVAHIPDHYNDLVRALGLYPLSQIGVAFGFERWKSDNLPSFDQDPLVWSSSETRYGLSTEDDLTAEEIAAFMALSSHNHLDIPDLTGNVLTRLAARFAPIFAVAEMSGADRIGRPFWQVNDDAAPRTDPSDPTLFVRLAHTRFKGEILPQLVYTVWFPARPQTGTLDILAGAMDGLVWRVTLGRDGQPLLYDTFHACGCYHLFFPVSPTRRLPVPEDEDLREEPLVPMTAPSLREGERIVIHVAETSHYVRALSTTGVGNKAVLKPLRLVDEMAAPAYGLRSIEDGTGTYRSLFGPDGVVPGTERGERFILWPMGIGNPGAMRQWGTHATAFVGTRHADDPFLLDQAFSR